MTASPYHHHIYHSTPTHTSSASSSSPTPSASSSPLLSNQTTGTLDYRNKIFIAVIAFYSCTAILSTYRLIRHGLKKTAVERILLFFSIGRILCGAFQLATITWPTNTSLWAGYVTTFSIAISLLLSAALALLARLALRAGSQFPKIRGKDSQKLCQILVTIALVLGIAGGIRTNSDWGNTGVYTPDALLKVSSVIYVVAWLIIVVVSISTLLRSNPHGPKHQKLAVAAFGISLPLMVVRIAYSCITSFANPKSFSSIDGNPTIMLCVALIEEAGVTLIYEVLGMVTLEKKSRNVSVDSQFSALQSVEEAKTPGNYIH